MARHVQAERAAGPQALAVTQKSERSTDLASERTSSHRAEASLLQTAERLNSSPRVQSLLQLRQAQNPSPNKTGMPDSLKLGMEERSGLSLDDVRVHYNSPRPASFGALALTQGKDIHVAPGQEQHLAHEAWHTVQQKQGRVRPTTQQAGVPINDDAALEREADQAAEGLSAPVTQRLISASGAGSTGSEPLQLKLKDIQSDNVDSPAGAIRKALGGLPAKNLNLPGSQPANEEARARRVEALVTKKTLRDTERGKSGNLSKITSMARAEQFILQGADVKKFFDAGHLVADQLVGGKYDSFVMWNLAPQASDFNAPTYAQIMEEEVKAAAAGADVEVDVEVDYPDGGGYKVKVKDLIARGIVQTTGAGPGKIKIGTKVFPDSKLEEEVTIPRRVPNRWKMRATTKGSGNELPAIDKSAEKGALAANYVGDLSTAKPNIGTPFNFTVSNSALSGSVLKIAKAQQRVFEAKQWSPAAGGVPAEDLLALVAKTFPDFGTTDSIINALKGSGDVIIQQKVLELYRAAAQKVGQGLSTAVSSMTGLMDPTLLKPTVDEFSEKISSELESANTAQSLDEALVRTINAQSLVEDLNEILSKERASQALKFVFPLSTVLNLQQSITQTPPLQSGFTFESLPMETSGELEPIRDISRMKDFSGPQYEAVRGDGELRFFHFGFARPADVGELIKTREGVATVTSVYSESSELGMPNGVWHLTYKYGL